MNELKSVLPCLILGILIGLALGLSISQKTFRSKDLLATQTQIDHMLLTELSKCWGQK